MLPENLERKVRILDAHSNVAFVHSDLIEIEEDGQVLREWSKNTKRDYVENGLAVFERYIGQLHFGAMVFIGAVLARRTCYRQLGGFRPDLRYTHDSEMWMRMALFYDVACIGAPLVQWRQHRSSASTGLGYEAQWLDEHYRAARIVLRDHRNRIPNWNRIREQVCAAFADRAFDEGWKAYYGENIALSRRYFQLAATACPSIIRRKRFWQLGIRLAAGRSGIALYRAARQRLRLIR
jgi:hypothetical protein